MDGAEDGLDHVKRYLDTHACADSEAAKAGTGPAQLRALVAKGYIELDPADCNGGAGTRYPRVIRWPACVLPILRLAAPAFATVEAGA